MSSHNGDKSRYQITRKRGVLRRAKIKKLVADARRGASTGAAPRPAKAAK